MSEVIDRAQSLRNVLSSPDSSVRLQAAMSAGIHPDSAYVDVIVDQFATEPEFFVRDMLSWALINQDRELSVARVLRELESPNLQARAQSLHALSKLREPSTWSAITDAMLFDKADQVARTAWRAAVVLVPEAERAALAEKLCTQLGRGDRETRLSLSRELLNLGESALPAIQKARKHKDLSVRTHAIATEHLDAHPDAGFDAALDQAKRLAALQDAPTIDQTLIK